MVRGRGQVVSGRTLVGGRRSVYRQWGPGRPGGQPWCVGRGLRKALPRHLLIDDEQGFIGLRIEVLVSRHDLAAKEEVNAGGIKIAALEGLVAEMVPKGMQEGGVDPVLLGAGPRMAGQRL